MLTVRSDVAEMGRSARERSDILILPKSVSRRTNNNVGMDSDLGQKRRKATRRSRHRLSSAAPASLNSCRRLRDTSSSPDRSPGSCPAYMARITRRMTLPFLVFGNSCTNRTASGLSAFPMACFTRSFNSCSRAGPRRASTLRTQKQISFSPLISSGTPIAAASLTIGCAMSTDSISAGPTRLPAILSVSSDRPRCTRGHLHLPQRRPSRREPTHPEISTSTSGDIARGRSRTRGSCQSTAYESRARLPARAPIDHAGRQHRRQCRAEGLKRRTASSGSAHYPRGCRPRSRFRPSS